MKKCSRCHQRKPLSDFYRDKHQNDGRRHLCADCDRSRVASRYTPKAPRSIACKRCGTTFTARFARKYCDVCRAERHTLFVMPDQIATEIAVPPWAGSPSRNARKMLRASVDAGACNCAICGRWVAPWEPWDVEHVVPRDVDPARTHDESNWDVAHRSCNRSAGATYGNRKRGAIRKARQDD